MQMHEAKRRFKIKVHDEMNNLVLGLFDFKPVILIAEVIINQQLFNNVYCIGCYHKNVCTFCQNVHHLRDHDSAMNSSFIVNLRFA